MTATATTTRVRSKSARTEALSTGSKHVVAALVPASVQYQGDMRALSGAELDMVLERVQTALGDTGSARSTGRAIVVHLRKRDVLAGRRKLWLVVRDLVHRPIALGRGGALLDIGSAWAIGRGDARKTEQSVLRLAARNLEHRDLMLRYAGAHRRSRQSHVLLSVLQVIATVSLFYGVPFSILVLLKRAGLDLSTPAYWLLVFALGATAVTQWAEALHAVKPIEPPPTDGKALPPATAIIAAYLPNEAETILETLHSFLAQRYAGGLQVILAYNSPTRLPIEDELEALAAATPALELVRVPRSRSKAQNVNAALAAARGRFVGVFDADHHPMQGAFERAWRWISSGVDVVQGHCVIRNRDSSWVAGMVAIEFEQIYAVSHPGRQVLHTFGVFGGSNGFWRTEVLREIRLRRLYLTEDIDASIRAVREGRVIVNDPWLISRELAPESLVALWRQRMRWAQGWFQVTLRHVHSAASDKRMTPKQRRGLAALLGWREIYAWLSALAVPLVAFYLWRDGTIKFTSTFLLASTLFVLTTGPVQVWFAYHLGAPEVRDRPWRWVLYVLFSAVFFQEFKNFIGRMAQIKHLLGERQWVVTARSRGPEHRSSGFEEAPRVARALPAAGGLAR